jgi:uncharacterized protein YecT (DUF1311 family)
MLNQRTLWLLAAINVLLLSGPTFSNAVCDKALSTDERMGCLSKTFEEADKRLNNQYKRTMGYQNQNQKELLKEAQRVWIMFRDKNCDLIADNRAIMGSGQNQVRLECKIIMTEQRSAELEIMTVSNPDKGTIKKFEPASYAREYFYSDGKYRIPSITQQKQIHIISNVKFKMEIKKRALHQGSEDDIFIAVPFDSIPKSTVDYTRQIIQERFFNNQPYFSRYADRYADIGEVTANNYDQIVEFVLRFEPLSENYRQDIRSIWHYQLFVYLKNDAGGSKYKGLLQGMLVSEAGVILYEGDNWFLGHIREKGGNILIDVLTDYERSSSPTEHANMTKYSYRPGANEMTKIEGPSRIELPIQ